MAYMALGFVWGSMDPIYRVYSRRYDKDSRLNRAHARGP